MKYIANISRRSKAPIILTASIVVAAVIGYFVFNALFLFAGGQLISRSEEQLDLRGKNISIEDYLAIQNALPDCRIEWDVPFQGVSYPSDSKELSVTSLTEEDVLLLDYFPALQHLNAEGCTDYMMLDAFQLRRPDCTVSSDVALGSQQISRDTQTLRVENPSLDELESLLSLLPRLEYLEMGGELPPLDELMALQEANPEIAIRWETAFRENTYLSDTVHMDLTSYTMSYADTETLISRFPILETVDMRGCGLSDEEMMALADAFPQTFFIWDMEVAGMHFSTDCVEIDISGQTVTDPAEIEAVLPYFHNLERVVMSDCGLDNETMDALNRRHEDIRFIWTVYLRWHPFRTDAKYFYPYKIDPNRYPYKQAFTDLDLIPLRYCTDMESIDIGHIANITTIEWAAYMPNLRFLIITDCAVTDLTPLENCKELVYFEATGCKFLRDLTPLVHCTGLENVNLGWTYCSPTGLDQMPWLHHVWWNCIKGLTGMPCANAEQILRAALPTTVFMFDGAHPVDKGWRELQTYADMRDLMDMFYLR